MWKSSLKVKMMPVACNLLLLVFSMYLHTVTGADGTFTNGEVVEDEDATKSLCAEDWSFKCDESMQECIDPKFLCNGVSECLNGRDESVEQCGCLPNEFQCNRSHCIDVIKRCDLTDDCQDGSDERNCETYLCPLTHVKCTNHFCVPRDLMCDYVDDCGDNSDEAQCEPRECAQTEFRCNNSECVSMNYICDGQPDCKDHSDELPESCERNFKCPTGLYILQSLVCDGWEDCVFTHADEFHCRVCRSDEFRCNSSRCISRNAVCDGVCDCINTCEDENGCRNYGCKLGEGYLCRTTHRCLAPDLVCDGHNDCKNTQNGMDEHFCQTGNRTNCNGLPVAEFGENPLLCDSGQCVPDSTLCDHYMDCLDGKDEENCDSTFKPCEENQFQCSNKQCIHKSARCDGKPDCIDRTDEVDCGDEPCPQHTRRCGGGQCVSETKWCDFERDCPDGSDEMSCRPEMHPQCTASQFRCSSGQCVDQDVVCYDGKAAKNRGCKDNSHLINCTTHSCKEGQFKCRRSYCVDSGQRCDGVVDCLMAAWDEHGCAFKCPYYSPVCICEGEDIHCENKQLTTLPHIERKAEPFSKFHFSGNRLELTADTFVGLDRMTYLDLSNNSLESIPDGCFQKLWRLVYLNLKNNKLHILTNGTFQGLSNLRTLFLEGNEIGTIVPHAFVGLASLTSLDLSKHRLSKIPQNAFVGLRNLHVLSLSQNLIDTIANGAFNGLDNLLSLDLSQNVIVLVEKNVFHGMGKLDTLYTDGFWFCCLAGRVPHCYPEPDEFSSCEDLMSNYVLRVSIWVLGMVASFGNLLVIGWRARDMRCGKVHSFLITNLALGDFFMGVYLLIIAVVDSYYRGVYIIYDRSWRTSDLCRFSGFISTFSSELSVFTLTVITLDRLVCIIFPLKLKRLGLKQATIVMLMVWLAVFIVSILPLLGFDYFREFYGRSGVCLALHVTPDRPPGWEYSVAIFLVLNFASFLLIFFSYLWMFFIAKRTRSAVRSSESKNDSAMARRMTLIVMTDFCCWVPIILLGFASLGGARSSNEVYAWIAVFVLPLNSAINPILYTISTAPFLGNVRKRASRFRKSFISSFTMDNTKHSYVDDRTTNSYYDRKSPYRQMDLIRMRSLNRSPLNSHSESDI
ncbi:G-protein coupled receptor GRL101-like [Pomacea canaliculata]|uniref:G-protein coupled receptor GRL101-like n=1 Tax=Pomacea canaliculata TaxID=400727 RepID=UPI000D73B5E8|nr:G-protein coupled receptor GRL101-like [Pomacea canaliculata]